MPPTRRRSFVLAMAFALLASGSGFGSLTDAGAVVDDPRSFGCLTSVPEPGSSTPVPICYTLYRPTGATASAPVPLILHSHGWGGTRDRDPNDFGSWLSAGFGVLSFDQRGFGESGGQAHIENPEFEGQDVMRVVDFVAELDWVAQNAPGDPVLGAIGGSYGGGYQFVGAFTELRDRGATRFDALAPEITWWDLNESLAPSGVVRTEWGLLLYLAGGTTNANTATVTQGLLESALSGNWPARLSSFMAQNGPAWHVANGRRLDIPVLLGQGITDNLFPLDQALQNFDKALTPAARARSLVVGYNGGHVLPSLVPLGPVPGGDPCTFELTGGGDFGDLMLDFYREELIGADAGIRGRGQIHIATPGNRCVSVSSAVANSARPVGPITSTTAIGVPLSYPIAKGPITIAGTPTLDTRVTSLLPEGRLFLGLSVGTNALDAQLVGNNVLPLRQVGAAWNRPHTVTLPSVAVDVPAGKSLFLTVSPISLMSFGHGSRLPGLMTLNHNVVHLPVVPR